MLEDYKAYVKRGVKPKKVPMHLGVLLNKEDASKHRIQRPQSLSHTLGSTQAA